MNTLQSPPEAPNGQAPNPIEALLSNLEYQLKATREAVSDLENKLLPVMSPASSPPPYYDATPSSEEESPAENILKSMNSEIEGIRQYLIQVKDRVRL